MIIAVVVSTQGTLKETLARIEQAISEAKTLMPGSGEFDIACHGPRKGVAGKTLTSLQYRLTNSEQRDLAHLWTKAPDEVVKVA